MCRLKSCLVLKDRVYCPDYDHHQDMLDKLGIKDDYLGASKTFVRVELLPPDGVRSGCNARVVGRGSRSAARGKGR